MKENLTYILCIETANAITSVSIAVNGECIHTKEVLETNKAADVLHVLIEALLSETNLSFNKLNAIAISAGPGSYTGLRIAAAAAKGFCYALNIPLIAINTLQAMVHGIQSRYNYTDFDEFVPMIDARRMEVYTSFFSKDLSVQQNYSSIIIDNDFPNLFADNKKYLLFGNGAFKTKSYLFVPTIIVMEDFIPSSKDLCLLAFSSYTQNKFETLAYFEPSYTKAFYTTAK
jgi:tRNA threonylcarbamoyladenosine biosynthesis protein TsaB